MSHSILEFTAILQLNPLRWMFYSEIIVKVTLASLLTTGLTGNWTSVAFNIVFSCKISCCDWLWPNGCKTSTWFFSWDLFNYFDFINIYAIVSCCSVNTNCQLFCKYKSYRQDFLIFCKINVHHQKVTQVTFHGDSCLYKCNSELLWAGVYWEQALTLKLFRYSEVFLTFLP